MLFVPDAAWLFVPGAVLFHAGIWIAMGLDFSAQAATAVVVFANWPVIGALRAEIGAAAAGPNDLYPLIVGQAVILFDSRCGFCRRSVSRFWPGTGTTGCVPSPCRIPRAEGSSAAWTRSESLLWHLA